ncbi:unnamed protein product [Diamesa hyperborea]
MGIISDCIGECSLFIEPPNQILSIPPPPLPSFLLPRISDIPIPGNNHTQPCFAAFMCEPALGHSDHSGIEYIELPRNTSIGIDEPWFFVLISSLCGVLFLGAIFAIILLKCRESSCSYHDANIKHQMKYVDRDSNGNEKNGFVTGNGQLMTTVNTNSNHLAHYNNQPLPVLWATLTPAGTTQHFVSEPYPQEDHYEAIDYNRKYQACVNDLNVTFTTPKKSSFPKGIAKTTFENNGFVDYDYEEPAPLIAGSCNNLDDDSGYQETEYQDPQDINYSTSSTVNGDLCSSGSISNGQAYARSSSAQSNRQQRNNQMISTPTRIANPNIIAPLNSASYRTIHKNKHNSINHSPLKGSPILNKKTSTTLNRRVSDTNA